MATHLLKLRLRMLMSIDRAGPVERSNFRTGNGILAKGIVPARSGRNPPQQQSLDTGRLSAPLWNQT